jgi:hypothetical protein
MMIDDLRCRWREAEAFSLFRPLYDLISFVKDWLVLGHGIFLARRTYNQRGEPELVFKGGQERPLSLLALAYLRPLPARILDHLRRAARDWGRGEKCLVYIPLAFDHLGKLDDPEEAAFRLLGADEFMKIGVSARDLLKAFGLDRGPDNRFEKFNPDQRRVPKGAGRQSGRWTSGDGGVVGSTASIVAFFINSHSDWLKSHLQSLMPGDYTVDHAWPRDAVSVTRNDGGTVKDLNLDCRPP